MQIVLIRHGKPQSASNDRMCAAGFVAWVKRYAFSKVASTSRPQEDLSSRFSEHFCISSDLIRAIDSAKIAFDHEPAVTEKLLREMDIPRYKIAGKLRAFTWVYLNRALWMLGKKGPFESYSEARERSRNAAVLLQQYATEKQSIVVFGHGYMNLHLRGVLKKRGWKVEEKSNDYWGVSVLNKATEN
ncbi:histidine phosphatase family protein [Glaciecola sp. MH2013]|uniref:histidine phosphatase family protein n=1 Tax=Glaciecola sp. MH2013 TaxID=2785524 RepID=UPI00189DA017|nr:histidine phosphatase family protein [Glaciecola sp. MH2013]MBF7073564.1 histidine phosphatase family protein [Glaciecola sp. MH2013]